MFKFLLLRRASNCLLPSVISTERSERRNLILAETDSSIPLRSTRNDMRNVNYLVTSVVTIFLILFLGGCLPPSEGEKARDPRTVGEKDFDPLSLEGSSYLVVKPEPKQKGAEKKREEGIFKGEEGRVARYRVQVFATTYLDQAEEFAQRVRERVEEKVYIQYESPLYKVRVGDCPTEEEAKLLLQKISQAGFPHPWVVRVSISRGEE